MRIELEQLGKRFNRQWIFRQLSYNFESGTHYAITGPNGSGKSTLLQVIAGAAEKSEGTVQWHYKGKLLDPAEQYPFLSLAAPYMELIEELTLTEFFNFHRSFKPMLGDLSLVEIMEYVGLKDARNKQIRYFSSGMKQRVKLAQAFFSDVPVIMLDEPTSNLDLQGIGTYKRLLDQFTGDRLVFICSNDEAEIETCRHRINISDYKNFKQNVAAGKMA